MGETVWFKIYLMDDRSHQLKKEKAIVYIDLFDEKSKIEASKIIQTVNGLGENNIKLSSSLKSGTYKVRVYTKRMLKNDPSSIFERNILVYTPEMSSNAFKAAHTDARISQLNVDFFSEGNSLKNGAVARIGIKSFNPCGTGVALKGEIRDEKNKKIVAFYTSKSGLCSFSFLWDRTKEYKAWIYRDNETTVYDFKVRNLTSKGLSLKLVEHDNHYRVNLTSAYEKGLQECSFKIRQRQGLVDISRINTAGSEMIIKILKKQLTEGIFFFELLDSKDSVLAERMGYHGIAKKKKAINIVTSKTIYQPGDSIILRDMGT